MGKYHIKIENKNKYYTNTKNIYENKLYFDKYISQTNFSNLFNSNSQQLQGKSYNANAMWSPISTSRNFYEWYRGVIAIDYDGNTEKENLDLDTQSHHADATMRVANNLGANATEKLLPFKAALEANESGIVILQAEGNNCFIYLPEFITIKQFEKIIFEVRPRGVHNFSFSFVHNGQIYEKQTAVTVMEYVTSLARSSLQIQTFNRETRQ